MFDSIVLNRTVYRKDKQMKKVASINLSEIELQDLITCVECGVSDFDDEEYAERLADLLYRLEQIQKGIKE
jgi:hypothetical protein